MSTIKIDRGFTQKIHAQELRHTQAPQPAPEPPKSPGGWSKRMLFIVGGGVFLVLLAVAVGVSVSSKGPKKAPVAAKTESLVLDARPLQPVVKTRDVAKAPAAVKPVEATKAAAAPVQEQAPAKAVPPQEAKPPQPQKPVLREVPLGGPNGLRCDYYEHINGWQLSQLKSAPTYPSQPSRTVQVGRFELSEKLGDNYGARVRGYLVPPKSGAYRFAVCVDDSAELWLSTDEASANLRKIVTVGAHVGRNWTEKPEQQSAPCELEGGKRYYLEALMKQGSGSDYLLVGWSGPVSDKFITIDAAYLQPWTDAPHPSAAAAVPDRRKAKEALEAELAPARAAVAEQQRAHVKAFRFKEAAQALKEGKKTWEGAKAQELIDTAVQRYEMLAQLRPFLQKEIQRAKLRGVWTAFGGQADVTAASDEGVTVSPGRIVAWDKIPPDQMLRLLNATLPNAALDPATKGTLFLATALFCKEISGGIDLALKYRERAISLNSRLPAVADRLLGGSPESILAQPRIQASREELARAASAAEGLAAKMVKLQSEFSSVTGSVAGLNVEFWENVTCKNLDEVRKQGVTTKAPPNSAQRLADFATPENHGEKYVARVKGYLVPSESGEYIFYIAADDQGEFWLSPDENPDKAVLCVKIDTPVGRQQWDKDKRKSKPVPLVKGTRYFVKALLREGERGDHLAVAWSLAAENTPKLITSENLICASPTGLPAAAEEIRRKIEEDLQRAQSLSLEITRLREADEALEERQAPSSNQMAGELKKQADRAKEALHDVETLLPRIGSALPQLKTALLPESGKPAK